MKSKILAFSLTSFIITGFSFLGCSNDDDSSDSPIIIPTEEVTLSQLQNGFPKPTGDGRVPANKADAMEALSHTFAFEDGVSDVVHDEIDIRNININKSLNNYFHSISNALIKTMSSRESVEDSDSWDEEGTITLTPAQGFVGGTVDYDTSGSYSNSEIEDEKPSDEGLITGSGYENFEKYLKLKFTNVQPVDPIYTIITNGFLNDKSKESFNHSYTYDVIDEELKAFSFSGNIIFLYRDGYALSGDLYTGYFTFSCNLTLSINKRFSEAELDALNNATSEEEWESNFDDFLNAAVDVSGGGTAKFYNAEGEEIYSTTLTAEEIWGMDTEDI